MQSESELKKLTVSLLKALCKEKRITGYSKLGKDAIIQKLLLSSASAPTATPAPDNSTPIQNTVPSETPAVPSTAPSSSQPTPPNLVPSASLSRADGEPASKPPPKKRKNPPASKNLQSSSSQQPPSASDTQISSTPTASDSAPIASTSSAPDAPILPRVDGEPVAKPPKKRKNPPASQKPANSSTSDTHDISSTLTASNPASTVSASSQPSQLDLVSDAASTPARVDEEPAPKPPKKKQKKVADAQPASASDTRIPATSIASDPIPTSSATTPSQPSRPELDASIPARFDAETVPKPPKKRKNPAPSKNSQPSSSQQPISDTGMSAASDATTAPTPSQPSQPNLAVDTSSAAGEPAPKPPKKRKNPPASKKLSDSQHLSAASSTPASGPTPTAATASVPDMSVPPRIDAEAASKPRPKKRKNPPASESQSSLVSDSVFKVPTLPQRLTQDSTAPVSSSSTSVPSSATSTSASTSAAASKKRKIAADKTTSDASSATAKKRKTVPPTNSTAAKAATLRTVTPQPISAARTDSRLEADPILPLVHQPNAPKKPSGLTPIDPPPAKRQKVAPFLPLSTPSAAFKPLPPQTAAHSLPTPSGVAQDVVKLPQSKPKRFVPLVVARKPPVPVVAVTPPPNLISTAVQIISDASTAGVSLYHLDFPAPPPPPPLSSTTLPPKKSERKHVLRLSLLLSSVTDEDLRNCVFVSRLFRYSVYISASNRLVREFAGKRLSSMLAKYSPVTTNMWPYLQQRREEVSTRKREFSASFLSRVCAQNSISEQLWASPDHERQILIGLRFLLTRLFFDVSVGGGKEGKGWNEGQIVDAQEMVKDEVWMITVRHAAIFTSEVFYVLEPTCEPLAGMPISTSVTAESTGTPVRVDWSAYIAHRASAPQAPAPKRLHDYLSWTNHEEYEFGISRLWLKRVEGEGATGKMKRTVAERYILACVVANSLSGRYMSGLQMAQDFAGLPDVAPARLTTSPKVNLFLPAHHHVESMHFTTSGRALHTALAIVQTPGRIYFILWDNGMQVGCEEEGVAEVWMNILGCDNSGVASRK